MAEQCLHLRGRERAVDEVPDDPRSSLVIQRCGGEDSMGQCDCHDEKGPPEPTIGNQHGSKDAQVRQSSR